MCFHQTLIVIPKHWPNNINKSPRTVWYTEKWQFPKGATFDTTNIWPGELLHMEFSIYIVNYIQGFTSVINVVFTKARLIRIFTIASKWSPVRIIIFILKTFKNEQHPFIRVRADEDGALEKSADVTNLIVEQLSIDMENTGG